MDIQTQYDQLEASLIQLRASLSHDHPDYAKVSVALKELRRSRVAYELTKYSDQNTTTDNKTHRLTKGLKWNS